MKLNKATNLSSNYITTSIIVLIVISLSLGGYLALTLNEGDKEEQEQPDLDVVVAVVDSGIKIRANTSRGTMTLYVYCDDKEVVKDFLEKGEKQ